MCCSAPSRKSWRCSAVVADDVVVDVVVEVVVLVTF